MYLPNNTELQGGRYRVVRHISSGGFGNTYEGVHVALGKRVAIKEFYVKDFCNRDETSHSVTVGITAKTALVGKLRKKFVDEAKGLSTLQHPNIVSVQDVFEENGTAYYVMDYIDGPSLSDLLKREGRLSEARALKYIRQICDALQYVHAHNRLHLDVKPGNIMVDQSDRAMLIDFGTSKQYDEEAGENTSTLLGKTPGYAPLEQMSNNVVIFTPATDIYALGATLYKLLSGQTPPSAADLAIGESLPPLPANVSTPVAAAVTAAMQVSKAKRPQTIEEFRALLDKPAADMVVDNEDTIVDVPPVHKDNNDSVAKPAPVPVGPTEPVVHKNKYKRVDIVLASVGATEPVVHKNKYKRVGIVLAVIAAVIFVIVVNFGSDSANSDESAPEPAAEPSVSIKEYPIGDGFFTVPSYMQDMGKAQDGSRYFSDGKTNLFVDAIESHANGIKIFHDSFISEIGKGKPNYDTYNEKSKSLVMSDYNKDGDIYYVKAYIDYIPYPVKLYVMTLVYPESEREKNNAIIQRDFKNFPILRH